MYRFGGRTHQYGHRGIPHTVWHTGTGTCTGTSRFAPLSNAPGHNSMPCQLKLIMVNGMTETSYVSRFHSFRCHNSPVFLSTHLAEMHPGLLSPPLTWIVPSPALGEGEGGRVSASSTSDVAASLARLAATWKETRDGGRHIW